MFCRCTYFLYLISLITKSLFTYTELMTKIIFIIFYCIVFL